MTSSVGGVVSAPSSTSSVLVDEAAPFFPAPPVDLFAYAPTTAGAMVSWPAISAYDAQDGQLASRCTPASGSTFKVGSTTVTCSASDAVGNAASKSFTVKVVLQGLPKLMLPPGEQIVVKTAIALGASVTFDVTAKGADGRPIAALCAPASGSFFAAGTTKVSCTATDSVGMAATSGSFDVTVIPVPYLGVPAGAAPPAPASDSSGGCNVRPTSGTGDFTALAVLGLALVAARRRRSAKGVD